MAELRGKWFLMNEDITYIDVANFGKVGWLDMGRAINVTSLLLINPLHLNMSIEHLLIHGQKSNPSCASHGTLHLSCHKCTSLNGCTDTTLHLLVILVILVKVIIDDTKQLRIEKLSSGFNVVKLGNLLGNTDPLKHVNTRNLLFESNQDKGLTAKNGQGPILRSLGAFQVAVVA